MVGAWWLLATVVAAAPAGDKVTSIPGFEEYFGNGSMDFEVYSGYLNVSLPDDSLPYDNLVIHYEFHTCRAADCPVAVWHQGGPGGSSIFGAWTEMGPFQLMARGPVLNLEHAWNNAAHMLYLESPAGSTVADAKTGFSNCSKAGVTQDECFWTDKTQAVAYAHTLRAFFEAFPEFGNRELYLVGESYAGQYIPNIASFMVAHPEVVGKNLSGVAVGNGCWGGTTDTVRCNGYHAEQNDIEIYYGKGLISKRLYQSIQAVCNWSITTNSDDDDDAIDVFGEECVGQLDAAEDAVGKYNVYNVYDDCNLKLADRRRLAAGTSLKTKLREMMHEATPYYAGYPWNCESDPALDAYFTRADVQAALHLTAPGSGFRYDQSGPASITLYPELLKHMRVLIYNGDADLCVPYVGNEEWTTSMVDLGYATEKRAWHPWYDRDASSYAPAGYVTTYDVLDKVYSAAGDDFMFLTIRLAGHMVPQYVNWRLIPDIRRRYQPKAALSFFQRFLSGEEF
ncbi:hypothetical protein CTAYLR_005367 [Chrysophaeum taylorii]|uniref:Carboxypeptidase n=1 Tax=Chrysophaeum taylorii TaxID=2483200 RepID=A0AAD7XKC5_9STRA|nr:hypothetical protein CTAYLR_005367 [Chrysophaeum taylorii]